MQWTSWHFCWLGIHCSTDIRSLLGHMLVGKLASPQLCTKAAEAIATTLTRCCQQSMMFINHNAVAAYTLYYQQWLCYPQDSLLTRYSGTIICVHCRLGCFLGRV